MVDMEKEIESLEKASKNGDYRASYRLAQMYNQGINVQRDLGVSSEYFDTAFKQLNEATPTNETNYLLGTFYLFGLGTVNKDAEKALSLLKKGADKNDVNCIVMVANAYLYGTGVEKDEDEAYRLISKVKDTKHPVAYKIYADCKMHGLGTSIDYKEAVKYYRLATEKNDIASIFMLGTLYYEGKGVEKDEKIAFEYFEKAAKYNFPDALKYIAFFYSKGIYVKQDIEKEAEYLKRYADTGSVDGMFIYGSICLERQKGLFKYREGLEYLKRAVSLKDPRATHVLGKIYENGEYGVFVNKTLAFNHYITAYNLGLKVAAHDVLRCLKQSIGTTANPQKIQEFEKIVEELNSTDNRA